MRKVICAIMIALSLFVLPGCLNTVESLAKSETYNAGPASLAVYYESISDLCADAAYIVEATVTGKAETLAYDGIPVTITSVKVLEVIKGDIEKENEIRIIETGGYTEGAYISLGVPLLKEDQHMVLMLKYFDGPQADGCYVPLGAYQGKFIEKKGYFVQQTTKDAVLKDYTPVKAENFLELIVELVNRD